MSSLKMSYNVSYLSSNAFGSIFDLLKGGGITYVLFFVFIFPYILSREDNMVLK